MRRGKTSRASVGSARSAQNQLVARSLDSAVDFRLSLGSKHACLARNHLSIALRSGARDAEKGIDPLTVEAQLVEGVARDSCVRADAPRVRTPDPGAIQPQSGAALLSPATTLASLSGALGR